MGIIFPLLTLLSIKYCKRQYYKSGLKTGISTLQLLSKQQQQQQQQNPISGNGIIKTVKSYSYTKKTQVAKRFFFLTKEK